MRTKLFFTKSCKNSSPTLFFFRIRFLSKDFILEKMPVTLASRAEIVKKMDQQFNDDLKMRQDTTTVGKEMLKIASLIPIRFKN